MESTVPLAVPYPWTVSERQASPVRTRKRKIGSGLAYLYHCCSRDNTTGCKPMSQKALEIVKDLLKPTTTRKISHDIDGNGFDEDDANMVMDSTASHMQSSIFFSSPTIPQVGPPLLLHDANNDDDDEHIIEDSALHIVTLAQNGEISLLLQILKYVDEYVQSDGDGDGHGDLDDHGCLVPTKALVQACALYVNPSKTPGMLDAKEMVIAGLQFLCSSATWHGTSRKKPKTTKKNDHTSRSNRISLPLLEQYPQQQQDGLEKTSYCKVTNWKWSDFQTEAFGELQLIFDSSARRREVFVPRFVVSDADETLLLQKGLIPPSAAPKRKGPAPGFRRKSL